MAIMNFKNGRKKSKFPKESDALQDVLKVTGQEEKNLKPAHKEKMWYWEPTEETEAVTSPIFKVEKTEENTEQIAMQKAMNHFSTFEGNVKKDENETHYLFSKIRG